MVIANELQVTVLFKILTIYIELNKKNTQGKISIFKSVNLISLLIVKAAPGGDLCGT